MARLREGQPDSGLEWGIPLTLPPFIQSWLYRSCMSVLDLGSCPLLPIGPPSWWLEAAPTLTISRGFFLLRQHSVFKWLVKYTRNSFFLFVYWEIMVINNNWNMKRKPKGFTWPDPPTPLQAKLGFQILWWYFTKKEAVGQRSDSYAQVN